MNPGFRLVRAMYCFAIAIASLAGCATAPPEPESMQDPQADFSAYRTFGWHAPAGEQGTGKPASVVDGYIRTAIRNEMTRKGYSEAPQGTTADLTIDYEAASAETLKSNPFRIGIGVGSYGSSGGGSVGVGSSGVKQVKEGSLVVHVIDPARETEIWRGSIERELGKGGVQPPQVQAAVTELFADFPARGGPP